MNSVYLFIQLVALPASMIGSLKGRKIFIHSCSQTSKCPCNDKLIDPILNVTEQHFQMNLNDIFSFSLFRFRDI